MTGNKLSELERKAERIPYRLGMGSIAAILASTGLVTYSHYYDNKVALVSGLIVGAVGGLAFLGGATYYRLIEDRNRDHQKN
jgi:uncharacterized membrane protein (DUF441 family)